MDGIDEALTRSDLNIKTLVDWDNLDKVEQLTIYLREMQTDLETKMTQSIESHILGKQRMLNQLTECLPMLQEEKSESIKLDPDL